MSLLRNAQLEAEFCQSEMCRKAVIVQLRGSFKFIDCRVNVACQGMRHAQKHARIREVRRVFDAAGERRNRGCSVSRLKTYDSFLKGLLGLQRQRVGPVGL